MLALLISAMMLVESGGDAGAVGDGGRALGVLQIHACVVKDVNRRYNANFTHADALDPEKAVRICRLYLAIYAGRRTEEDARRRTPDAGRRQEQGRGRRTPDAGKTEGRGRRTEMSDEERLARIWNGGPNGHRKAATLKYWKKVEKKYNELLKARKTMLLTQRSENAS